MLSYDITVLAILMKIDTSPLNKKAKCITCKKNAKCDYKKENWKRIAALNILIAEGKLQDDILDEKSAKARVAKIVFGHSIKKAISDYPRLNTTIQKHYSKIRNDEKSGCDVIKLSSDFSYLMVSSVKEIFDIDEWQQRFISVVSRWLYFIDAVDDYDSDIKKGQFNPFKDIVPRKKGLVDSQYLMLNSYIEKLYFDIDNLIADCNNDDIETSILKSILINTIPIQTSRVLTKK